MLRVLSIKITHLLFPLLTHSQGKRWADDNQPGWPGRFSLDIVLSVLKNVPTTPHQLTLHRRKQWRINSAKRKENWKKQLQIFAALALYCNCMLLFPFWQKCRSSLWKCCLGCGHLNEKEVTRTGWVSPANQPATDVFFQCIAPSWHSTPGLLDWNHLGRERFLWNFAPKIKVISFWKAYLDIY